MRKAFGLVLATALIAPFSVARAAEVTHFSSNGKSAHAFSQDPSTGATIDVFVSREDVPGKPVYRVFFVVSTFDSFTLGTGLLPDGAFKVSAKKASLDVDIHDVALEFLIGEIPENADMSIDWQATGVERTSGNAVFNFEGGRAIFTGTASSSPAAVDGEVFGMPMVNSSGDMSILHQNTIIQVF
jgi:hypothetical protein